MSAVSFFLKIGDALKVLCVWSALSAQKNKSAQIEKDPWRRVGATIWDYLGTPRGNYRLFGSASTDSPVGAAFFSDGKLVVAIASTPAEYSEGLPGEP